ncbi:MAG: DNA-processing protein DprA [Lachnospiraceae bacterium]|nr:DNA-processing protein DprA [Lachnospiraceae bacterium]
MKGEIAIEKYWEWLCSIPGMYRTQQEILLRFFKNPEEIYRASEKELDYLKEKGCRWIGRVRQAQDETVEKIMHRNREKGIQFISHEHTMYPKRLRGLSDRPYGLFYRGRLPQEERKTVAVVGARMCTRRGKERAEQIAAGIAGAGGQVVSGAAYGIDGAAQWSALSSGGMSFGILGCGADRCYPAGHAQLFEHLAQEGGLISEFPPGTAPMRMHFPMRNRIISGLSDVVVVVEARKKSGSLITAEFAAEQGRIVMAVPGRPEDELSEGCNELISQGAGMILSVESFISSIFPDYISYKKQLSEDLILAPAEKLVYSSLDLHSKSLWELEECTVLSLAELSESLLALERKGLIKEAGRNYYMRSE